MKFPLSLVGPVAGAVGSVASTVISKRAECKNHAETEKTKRQNHAVTEKAKCKMNAQSEETKRRKNAEKQRTNRHAIDCCHEENMSLIRGSNKAIDYGIKTGDSQMVKMGMAVFHDVASRGNEQLKNNNRSIAKAQRKAQQQALPNPNQKKRSNKGHR